MPSIHQKSLPVAPWMADHTLRLPGTVPIEAANWLQRDDVYAEQMAYRDALIATRSADVHALMPGAEPAAEELLATVLEQVSTAPDHVRTTNGLRRLDGVTVPLDGPPLAVAGRLAQEDFCLLEKPGNSTEHVLTGAVLCFPSNWTLAQKLGHTLGRIHLPVERYDADIARRVQRLFDLIRPGAPMMRANLLPYAQGDLYNPRREFDRHTPAPGTARYVRVERQVILRLPVTRAVVFSIHTYMVPVEALSPDQAARLTEVRPEAFAPA